MKTLKEVNMETNELRSLVLSILQEDAKRKNAELDKARNQTLIVLTILFVLFLVVEMIKHI